MPDGRLTPNGDDLGVWKALLSVSIASLALATAGAAAVGPALPAGWTHAEINFSVNRVPHTLILDRGRVTTVSASSTSRACWPGRTADACWPTWAPT